MKVQVSYSQKVSTHPYENISIGMQIEETMKSMAEADQKYHLCKDFVVDKIEQRKHEMGLQE